MGAAWCTSAKEGRELVYYTADDIAKASFWEIDNVDSLRPWAFQVQVSSRGDVEFTPSEFAAESEVMRRTWINELRKLQAKDSLGADHGFVGVETRSLKSGSFSWGWLVMLIVVLSAGMATTTSAYCIRLFFGEDCAVAADPAAC